MKNSIIVLLVLAVLGLAGYTFYNQAQPDYAYQPSATAPVLNTPDNSFVTKPAVTVDETANWKTYKNEQYGFEFKYPVDFQVSASGGEVMPGTNNFVVIGKNDLLPEKPSFSISINSPRAISGDRYYELSRKTDGGINVVSVSDTNDGVDDSRKEILGFLQAFGFGINYKIGGHDYEPLFKQILSTFRFTK